MNGFTKTSPSSPAGGLGFGSGLGSGLGSCFGSGFASGFAGADVPAGGTGGGCSVGFEIVAVTFFTEDPLVGVEGCCLAEVFPPEFGETVAAGVAGFGFCEVGVVGVVAGFVFVCVVGKVPFDGVLAKVAPVVEEGDTGVGLVPRAEGRLPEEGAVVIGGLVF